MVLIFSPASSALSCSRPSMASEKSRRGHFVPVSGQKDGEETCAGAHVEHPGGERRQQPAESAGPGRRSSTAVLGWWPGVWSYVAASMSQYVCTCSLTRPGPEVLMPPRVRAPAPPLQAGLLED